MERGEGRLPQRAKRRRGAVPLEEAPESFTVPLCHCPGVPSPEEALGPDGALLRAGRRWRGGEGPALVGVTRAVAEAHDGVREALARTVEGAARCRAAARCPSPNAGNEAKADLLGVVLVAG